jgi:hypothetical protein
MHIMHHASSIIRSGIDKLVFFHFESRLAAAEMPDSDIQ